MTGDGDMQVLLSVRIAHANQRRHCHSHRHFHNYFAFADPLSFFSDTFSFALPSFPSLAALARAVVCRSVSEPWSRVVGGTD